MNSVERKDKNLVWLSAIIGILYFMLVFFEGHGIGTVIFFLCYYGMVFYAGKGTANFSARKGKIYLIPIIVLALCFLIYDNSVLNFFNVPLMMILITLHTATMFSQNDSENPVVLFFRGFFKRPVLNGGKMFKVIMTKEEKPKDRTGLGIFIGVLVGLPIFAVVTLLLCSADQRFGQITSKMLDIINVDFLSIISDIVLGMCLSIFIYGAISYNRHTAEIPEEKQRNPFVINQAVGTTVLFMVSISYILYLVLQFEYLFSAISGKLPENFIYSQYARSGFFELFTIAVINFVLVVFFANTGKGKVLKTAVLLVSSITLLLIISSVSKMILYIREYDLTRLRVYTTWFMVVLFIVFLFIIVKMFNEKIKIFNSSLAIFISMYLILNIVNTDGIIGKYNTENYMSGNRETIDIGNIASLSDSGIIYLEKIAEGDYPESEQATYALCERKNYINNKKDWQGFNISTLILKEKLKNIDETVYVYYD